MGDRTGIEWTDATWNPQVGCSRVSRGCQHCYAETQAAGRLVNVPAYRGVTTNGRFNGTINLLPDRLDQPLRWQTPRLIFVNSMSDLFHENAPVEWIARVFAVMAKAQWHTFQVLTKRPERMIEVFRDPEFHRHRFDEIDRWILPHRHAKRLRWPSDRWPSPNVWLGVSVESDQWCSRVDVIRDMPAAIRWVSAEPLVGPLPSLDLRGIGWVVVGGESGRGAAPMHRSWSRAIRDQCVNAGVPFLYKQAGEWASYTDGELDADRLSEGLPELVLTNDGATLDPDDPCDISREPSLLLRVGKKAAGRELDGRTWDEYPAVSDVR